MRDEEDHQILCGLGKQIFGGPVKAALEAAQADLNV